MERKGKTSSGLKRLTESARTTLTAAEIDVTDLIDVICGYRPEQYPFERHVALLTFSTWMHWPNNDRITRQASVVSAASVILAIDQGRLKMPKDLRSNQIALVQERALPLEATCDALIKRALVGLYCDEFEFQLSQLSDVESIAAFIIRCPIEMGPSLNKAMFFIDEKGFVSEDTPDDKASVATLKKSWSAFARVAPFVFAAAYWEEHWIYGLPPDDENAIVDATKKLKNESRLRRFFGTARYIQELMVARLDKKSLELMLPVEFSKNISPCLLKLFPLEPDQLEILRRYRVPKPS